MAKLRRRPHVVVVRPRPPTTAKQPKAPKTPKFLLKERLIPTPLPFSQPRKTLERPTTWRSGRFRFFTILRLISFLIFQRIGIRIRSMWSARPQSLDAPRLRGLLQNMGGVWVKAGQLIAMRRDLFSNAVCDELGHLHDSADGFPGEVARRIIEEDLGQSIEQIFSEFDERPLAAASIGQTHRGRLRAFNADVVVKVRRPFIVEQFAADLRIVRKIIWILDKLAPSGRWYEMLWELEKTLSEELDYRREGAALKHFRSQLKQHKVHVPRPFLMYTRERVLIMEFLNGVFMSDFIRLAETYPEKVEHWLDENNIDVEVLGQRLYCSMMRQAFEDHRFHSDLHPGNIVLLRDSRFALIDFGSTGSFDRTLVARYHKLFEAMTEKNYERTAELFLMLGPALPHISLDGVKTTLVHVLRDWDARTNIKRLPYHEKSLTSVFNEIGRILAKFEVPPTWEALRFNRALYTLDASLMFLIPRVNYSTLARRYWRGFQRRQVQSIFQRGSVGAGLYGLSSMLSLPRMIGDNLYFQGETLRKNAIMFQGRITNAAYSAQQILSWLLRLLFIGGAVFLYSLGHRHGHRLDILPDELHCALHKAERFTQTYGVKFEHGVFALLGSFSFLHLLVRLRSRFSEAVPDLLVSRRNS